ncbi:MULTISPECIES: ExbD/TolR family protein [Nitrospirillum]|uniref:Outer membrane transport energization protein ExbD n=1 Tax=Nitrospirillum amazonense TaxID=28077 RepID=A0A560JQD7_9PROT|nr:MULTISPECIES: biopolymer transporter ExbD [Nitrospirillum]MDZ5647231.1 biopolymer transporter ExbD [Nitrospirillum sp. BR 11828]MEE3626642.1 biopolymer transporter ExbD [Nitrospirillum sp. BR 11752]TWB45419.1 outer membrane transport energization protein ExbD [Nitrospirillum amazonense]TWB73206.1 outer membrane transport energization protein ExbD [Nitrospirillum amazonense]
MGMNVGGGGEDEAMMDINTTPLIDVMLVLIIMLIITIPIQTHAVKLDMPSATPPQSNTTPPEVVNIMVDFDNTIQWNGTTVDRHELELRLKDAALKNPQPEVHLWPNKLAKYNTVAMVMASAQRLGVTKLGLVGAEQFMD